MSKSIYTLLVVTMLTSCVGSYEIKGTSSIPTLDGRMLYLKVVTNNELKNIDSCDVVHGLFHFAGNTDSAVMANLFMDNQSIMPIVLEQGDISIKLDNTEQVVAGTPLNDKLYKFIDKRSQLDNQMNELSHKESQMVMDGGDLDEIRLKLNDEANEIAKQEDLLETTFIIDNFNNVLGPGVFMMLCSGYKYPILTPQIEDIMSKATSKFKNNPFVKDYYQTACENMQRMQGVSPGDPTTTDQASSADADDETLPAPSTAPIVKPVTAVPTANAPQ
jgi:hypothetical protein